jgi:hypothetical protein
MVANNPESHIMPIYRIKSSPNGEAWPSAFCGTGFIIREGIFVTCWHCVEKPLDNGESYAAIYPTPNGTYGAAPLLD